MYEKIRKKSLKKNDLEQIFQSLCVVVNELITVKWRRNENDKKNPKKPFMQFSNFNKTNLDVKACKTKKKAV